MLCTSKLFDQIIFYEQRLSFGSGAPLMILLRAPLLLDPSLRIGINVEYLSENRLH